MEFSAKSQLFIRDDRDGGNMNQNSNYDHHDDIPKSSDSHDIDVVVSDCQQRSFNKMTQIGDLTSIGIPLTASMTAGFTVGFIRS